MLNRVRSRIALYLQLIRFDRPIGTLLLLWPTLWGLWIAAEGLPAPTVLLVFLAGTFLMRSAGCAINDFADRDFDGQVERTKGRPLAAGTVSPLEAVVIAALLALTALLLVVLFLDRLTLWLSIPAAFLAASYPFTKRFLAIPQAYLGLAFGFGIPMAFAAQTGTVPTTAWALLLASALWTIAYDTEYAMVDREDDLRLGLRTSAVFFGANEVSAVMFCYAGALVILAAVGVSQSLAWPYFLGLVCAVAIATYHYSLIRHRDRSACFKAFLHNSWFGATVFLGIVINYAIS